MLTTGVMLRPVGLVFVVRQVLLVLDLDWLEFIFWCLEIFLGLAGYLLLVF